MSACPHRPPCPGCPRFGEPGIAPRALAVLGELARAQGLTGIQTIVGAARGFRHRARLAIRGRVGSPKIGLFELGTHRVVQIPNCLVHHPLINRVAGIVRRALIETGLSCYSDKAHRGIARHLQVVIERSSQSAQVVLVVNAATCAPLRACLELIRERLGRDLHSLWLNFQRTRSNVILGEEFEHCHGPPALIEHFGGAAIHYPPGAFGQSNLEMAGRIIARVRDEIPRGARVTELYAGVGAIGLSVLDAASTLRLNEIGRDSLAGLELGLRALDATERAKVSVLEGAAQSWTDDARDCDVLLVDPPRKGLDAVLCEQLSENPPARIVYVSCGLESFVDDTHRLLSRFKLKLASLAAYDLFPYTEHAETVARFERV